LPAMISQSKKPPISKPLPLDFTEPPSTPP
jgi:hypothetical protein